MGSGVGSGVDPASLSHSARLDLLAAVETERARLDAVRARTLAAIEADDASEKHWAREEVAVVLRLAPATVVEHVKAATQLVSCLPATLDALSAGRVSWPQANALVEATYPLDAATTAKVEKRCLGRVERGEGSVRTVGQFRDVVRRAVAAADPRGLEQRHTTALAQRRVVFTPNADGTGEVWALLSAPGCARLKTALDRAARLTRYATNLDGTRSRDPRTADQRRADALTDLALLADTTTATRYGLSAMHQIDHAGSSQPDGGQTGADTAGADADTEPNAASTQRPRVTDRLGAPAIQVTVAATTLLELDDAPGELAGHGPIPASVARAIAADPTGTWRRILTDPAGKPLDVSRAYQPPPRLRRFVVVRDRTCRFPGCGQRSATSELDHIQDRETGGPTADTNLHPLCPRHHHLKHEAPDWHVERIEDGTTRWRMPTGQIIDVPPDTYDDTPTTWATNRADHTDDSTTGDGTDDLDLVAPVGGYHPDAPPDLEEPDDLDDRYGDDQYDDDVA